MMRLDTVAKILAEELRMASPEQQRAASLMACEFAFKAIKFENEIYTSCFETLKQNRTLSKEQIDALNDLVKKLDNEYFSLLDRNQNDIKIQNEALNFFSQARAASALCFANNDSPLVAAMESIYEASMAIDKNEELFRIICFDPASK